MPKIAQELTAIQVRRLSQQLPTTRPFNYYPVGGVAGLLLRVSRTGSGYWVLRASTGTKSDGKPKRRDIGLGAYPEVSLKVARDRASEKRHRIREGFDPVEDRRAARQARQALLGQHMTFAEAVELAKELEGIGDDKTGKAWQYRLDTYAIPYLGNIPIAEIERHHIAEMLKPIWSGKTRTAKEVRRLVQGVINRAYADKKISKRNPAILDDVLKDLLPKKTKMGGHFASLPFEQINNFLKLLRADDSTLARAVEFAIFTGTRSNEVCGATWREIDFDRKRWVIPPERMKSGEEHIVPLSHTAIQILKSVEPGEPNKPIFPTETGRHAKDARLSKIVREIGQQMGLKATVHGFRATFRTWGTERTDHPEFILELALAHKVDDALLKSYRRTTVVEKRSALMDDWAAFCEKPSPEGELIKMEGKA